jgi:hypothetical protein
MIISVAALTAALIPLLLGGRLSRLGDMPFRHVPWIVTALAVQIVIIELLPGPHLLLQAAHIATYAIAGWFIAANRRIPGLWLIGIGAGFNGLAITLNDGTLPARPEALQTAGIRFSPGQFMNSGFLPHPRLAFLGDIFAIPAGLPLANVFSIGDTLIVLGTGWTAWAVLGTRWTRPWKPTPGLHAVAPGVGQIVRSIMLGWRIQATEPHCQCAGRTSAEASRRGRRRRSGPRHSPELERAALRTASRTSLATGEPRSRYDARPELPLAAGDDDGRRGTGVITRSRSSGGWEG